MTIDVDVAVIAKRFGVDPLLIQAVVQAEGDIVKAVQCSIPTVTSRAQAIEILCRSAAHALNDYVRFLDPEGFVDFWAARWAPQGAANDPNALNANWPNNVKALWLKP